MGTGGVLEHPKVSIIITNYNYALYVREAIESALGQDYKELEVIVVDDGSTDQSHEILSGYENVARIILKDNGGQASAFNAGYRASCGDLVMTLDADDVLDRDAISRVVAAWTAEAGEVHFPLRLIDHNGNVRRGRNPSSRVAAGDLARVLLKRGRYIGPPSSGNVYSRAVLDAIMPIPEDIWWHSDCYLETLAPFYGRVGALDRPAGGYRIHARSASRVCGLDRNRIEMLVLHDQMQDELLACFCTRYNIPFQRGVGLSHWSHLKLLLSLDCAQRSSTIRTTCVRFLSSVWKTREELTLIRKIELSAWAVAVTLLPGRAGRSVAQVAFTHSGLFG